MAQSKDDITYGAAQAKVSEDEAVRVAYKHGTPLEGGKVADSEPVQLFSAANRMSAADTSPQPSDHHHLQQEQEQEQQEQGMEGERQRPPKMAVGKTHPPPPMP